MRIDFDAMEETIIPHMRGGEKEKNPRVFCAEQKTRPLGRFRRDGFCCCRIWAARGAA